MGCVTVIMLMPLAPLFKLCDPTADPECRSSQPIGPPLVLATGTAQERSRHTPCAVGDERNTAPSVCLLRDRLGRYFCFPSPRKTRARARSETHPIRKESAHGLAVTR